METKAIAEALRPVIDSAVSTRVDASVGAAVEKAMKPIVERMTEVETQTRARPGGGLDGGLEISTNGVDFEKASTMTHTRGHYAGNLSVPGIEPRKFNIGKLVLALVAKKKGFSNPFDRFQAGYEKDVYEHVAKKRAITLGNDSQAGFLIPNEIMADIIDNLRPTSIQSMLGVQQLTGLTSSPVQIRRRTASTTGYWVGESTAITESVPTYDRLNLTPKKCAVLADISGDLFRKDPNLVQGEISRDIAVTLRLKEETAFFEGSGVAQPVGLDNITGINSITAITTTAAADVQSFMTMIEEVEVDNVTLDGACWVMHARAWHNLSQALSSSVTSTIGQPILSFGSENPQGSMQTRINRSLFGFPVHICNSLTASTTTIVKFLVPSEIIWAEWGNPEIAVSTEAGSSFANDEVLVRILHEVDVAARHPEAICKVTYTY